MVMAYQDDRRLRYIAGAATGVVTSAAVSAGTSAAIGYASSKVLAAAAGATAKIAPVAVTKFVGRNAGAIGAGAVIALASYQGYLAGRAAARSGASPLGIAAAAGLGAIGVSPASAKAIVDSVGAVPAQQTPDNPRFILAQSTTRQRVRQGQRQRGSPRPPPDNWATRARDAELNAQAAARKGDEATAKRWRGIAEMYGKYANGVEPGPVEPAEPDKPKSLLQEAKDFVLGLGARDPSYERREQDLRDRAKVIQDILKDDFAKRPAIGDTQRSFRKELAELQGGSYEEPAIDGSGRPQLDARGRQTYRTVKVSEKDSAIGQLRKQEADSNVFRQGFQTFAPIGAALGGLLVGGAISGAGKIAQRSRLAQREISALANQAEKLTRNSRRIVAGTVAGDRARAAVDVASQAARNISRHYTDYFWPAFNVAAGGLELAYGYGAFGPVGSDNARAAARVAGGFELGLGLGQLKAITAARAGARASQRALARIRGAENRLERESAAGASAKMTRRQLQIASARADIPVQNARRARDLNSISSTDAAARASTARANRRGIEAVAKESQNARIARAEGQTRAARRARNRGVQTTRSWTDRLGNLFTASNSKSGAARAVSVASDARAGRAQPANRSNYVNRNGESVQATAKQIAAWERQKTGRARRAVSR